LNQTRLVIRGWGLITPLGLSAWETFSALLAGRVLTDRAARMPEDIAAIDLVRALGCVSVAQHGTTDPAVELAERAAREALTQARARAAEAPILLGSSKGAVQAMTAAAARARGLIQPLLGQRWPADAELAVALGPHAYVAHHLSRRLEAPALPPVVAACASSLTAVHEAAQLLRGSRPQLRDERPWQVLVVTSESALLPQFVHSYANLGVLPPLGRDGYRAAPLDAARAGFVLTEVGAAVLLERLPPGQSPRPGQVELVDTAVASESQDIVRPAQPMAALRQVASQLTLDRAIDVLHPHATGTAAHDGAEMAVYADLPGTRGADVYADKGALGHGLGSAGLVSLVLACLIAQSGRRPAMPWLRDPLAFPTPIAPGETRRDPTNGACHAVFSAGFAGHVAGALVQRHSAAR
jgi:3-oxoacyl-[acyl-carrier-protein] synthase II